MHECTGSNGGEYSLKRALSSAQILTENGEIASLIKGNSYTCQVNIVLINEKLITVHILFHNFVAIILKYKLVFVFEMASKSSKNCSWC